MMMMMMMTLVPICNDAMKGLLERALLQQCQCMDTVSSVHSQDLSALPTPTCKDSLLKSSSPVCAKCEVNNKNVRCHLGRTLSQKEVLHPVNIEEVLKFKHEYLEETATTSSGRAFLPLISHKQRSQNCTPKRAQKRPSTV
jgi:hypothetical protein